MARVDSASPLVRRRARENAHPSPQVTTKNRAHRTKNEASTYDLYVLASFLRKTAPPSALAHTFLRSFCPSPPHTLHSESQKTPVIGLFDSKNYSKQIFISFLPRNSCRTRQRIYTFATKTEQNLREIALRRAITAGFLPIFRKSSIQSYNS